MKLNRIPKILAVYSNRLRLGPLLLILLSFLFLTAHRADAQYNSLGDVQITSYGTERMRVTTPGWVGIGTTSPRSALDIFMTGTSSALIVPRDTTGNRPAAGFQVNGMIRYNTTNNKFEAYENGAWTNLIGTSSQWTTSGSDIYYNSGNVGIGTTAPIRPLHIMSSASPIVRLDNPSTTLSGGAGIGSIEWHTNDADSPDQIPASIVANYPYANAFPAMANLQLRAGVSGGANNGGILFQDATGANTYMSINPLGNVGIGTTSPGAPLDIPSGWARINTTNSTGYLNVGGAITSTAAFISSVPSNNSNDPANASFEWSGGWWWLQADSSYNMRFNVWGPGAPYINAMTITQAGTVGVRTTNPRGALDIATTGTMSALVIPRDTTANRPAAGFQVNGMIRYNTTNNKFEAYENGAWTNMIGGATFPLTGSAGSASAPTYSFSGDTDTGWYSPGAGILSATTNQTERIRIDASGNVGVGTNAPSATFEVRANGAWNGFKVSNSTIGDLGFIVNNASGGSTLGLNTSAGGRKVNFDTDGVSYLLGGNFGIGTTTPVTKVHVIGDMSIDKSGDPWINFLTGGSNEWDLEGDGSSFNINESGVGPRITIATGGNVGINVGSPVYPLEVSGAGSSTDGGQLAQFRGPGSPTAGNLYGISIDKGGTDSVLIGINKNTATGSIPSNATYFSTWQTNGQIAIGRGGGNDLPASADIFINSSGNVGIGTTNPGAKLEVQGSSGSTLKIVDGNQAVGRVLTSDANGQASWQASGGRVLLATLTANNTSTTLSDTSSFTSAYKTYEIEIDSLVPAVTNAYMNMQVYSGGSFRTTSYTTNLAYNCSSGWNGTSSTTEFVLVWPGRVSNTAAEGGITGYLKFYNPSQTTSYKRVIGSIVGNDTFLGYDCQSHISGGWKGGTGAITGFRIYTGTVGGNLVSGTVRIYGVP